MDEEPTRTPPALFIIAGLAIVIGLVALIIALTPGAPEGEVSNTASDAPIEQATAVTAAPSGYSIASSDRMVKAALLAELPKAPPRDDDSDEGYCDQYHAAPVSTGARTAAAKGWLIAKEGRLGPLTAVTIVATFEPGTSGVCFPRGGNIAFFDGDTLVGILYSAADKDVSIGGFEAVGDRLRVGAGTPAPPYGDITLNDRAIRFGPIAASDSVCGGRRTVPNIYGLSIQAARRKLIASGWKPVPSTAEAEFLTLDLRNEGVVEANGCAPTGYGQCGFSYAAGRDRLGVGSVGDEPVMVSGYSVECRK